MITYAPATLNLMLAALAASLDAGAPEPGRLLLYSAAQPEAGAAISDQILLADCPLAMPCGTVNDGVLILAVPFADENNPASGTITWGRLVNGAGERVADLDVGIEGSGKTLELTGTTVYQGGIIKINSANLQLS